jgi:peroxiredoxin Q/BCP
VAVIGVSADPVKLLQSFRTKQKLNFILLSDPTHKMMEAYGAWRMRKFMGRAFKGIARSTVLIDPAGKIEEVWPEVKAKGHATKVLERVKS